MCLLIQNKSMRVYYIWLFVNFSKKFNECNFINFMMWGNGAFHCCLLKQQIKYAIAMRLETYWQ